MARYVDLYSLGLMGNIIKVKLIKRNKKKEKNQDEII
jgi:hypothetical protein